MYSYNAYQYYSPISTAKSETSSSTSQILIKVHILLLCTGRLLKLRVCWISTSFQQPQGLPHSKEFVCQPLFQILHFSSPLLMNWKTVRMEVAVGWVIWHFMGAISVSVRYNFPERSWDYMLTPKETAESNNSPRTDLPSVAAILRFKHSGTGVGYDPTS